MMLLLGVASLLLLSSPISAFTCLDADGRFVDWFAVYKLPRNNDGDDKQKNGEAFYSLNVKSPQWTYSKTGLTEKGQTIYNTLNQIYSSKNLLDFSYIMYNDQHPNETSIPAPSNELGHTKGVLAFNKTNGFWLIHSTPKFPLIEKYSWPENSRVYGQNFLCVSFPYKQLGVIGEQLKMNEPSVYSYDINSTMEDFPVLKDVINRVKPKHAPWFKVQSLRSLEGQEFTSFAKCGHFEKDLYEDLVAPKLKTSLYVESWQHGSGGKLPSNCSRPVYKVLNIENITIGDVKFSEEKDHSKWAVSASRTSWQRSLYWDKSKSASLMQVEEDNWICIGDINRMKSQFKRGGGTLCWNSPQVWHAYKSSISSYLKCP